MTRWGATIAALVIASAVSRAGQQDAASVLAAIGGTVDAYYSRARAVVARETVSLQPLGADLRPLGHARVLEYDVRIDWEPPSATIRREPLGGGGRITGNSAESACFDPEPAAFEPLAVLQRARQPEFLFTIAGSERVSGRAVTILQFRPRSEAPAAVTWKGGCGAIALNGGVLGRVWADTETGDVIRIDERLERPVPFLLPIEYVRSAIGGRISQTLDRYEVSTRYEAIAFRDPDERVTLPVSITTMTVIDNGGVPRLLTTHRFSSYRRFLTGARVVK